MARARAHGAGLGSATLAIALLALPACLRLEGPPPALEHGDVCTGSSQCGSGSVCEYDSAVSNNVCRVEGGCSGHSACLSDQACVFGMCTVAECTSDTCGAYRCNQNLRQCYDSCASDTNCGPGYVCRDGECLSATCNAETADRVCGGAACVSGTCQSAFDCDVYGCAPGYSCDSYDCVRFCSGDAQCERYTCFTELGECNTRCYSGDDCQAGYVCKDSFCQAAP